jgi:hypothetical protein
MPSMHSVYSKVILSHNDDRCIRRYVEMQVGMERRTCSLSGVAVAFPTASCLVMLQPLAPTVTDRGMVRRAPPMVLPLVRIDPRAARVDELRNQWRGSASLHNRDPKKRGPPVFARKDGRSLV